MRRLIDKVMKLEIIKITKPDGQLVAYQVEDRQAKPPTLHVTRFLSDARARAKELSHVNI